MQFFDSNVSVNMAELKPAKSGWKQAGPVLGPNGYEDLVEKITLSWTDLDDDTRAVILQEVGYLSRAAAIMQQPERPEYTDRSQAVVMGDTTPTESYGRYAIVQSMAVPQLHQRHQAQAGHLKLDLVVEREGLWRGIQPGDAGIQVISETVKNYTYGTDRNYVTIVPDDIPGDAPALAKIKITYSGNPTDRTWLMRRHNVSLTELNKFNPFFFAVNSTTAGALAISALDDFDGTGTPTTPDAIPGDRAFEFDPSGSGTTVYSWTIPAADMSAYVGKFNIWAIYRAEVVGAGNLQFRHGRAGKYYYGPKVNTENIPFFGSWDAAHLGTFKLPAGGTVGGRPIGDYQLAVLLSEGDAAAAALVQVAGFWLQPVDDQVMSVGAGLPDLFIDGDIRRCWSESGGALYDSSLNPHGDFIELEPGYLNRIYINSAYDQQAYDPAATYTVTVTIVPRYQYLRGSQTW